MTSRSHLFRVVAVAAALGVGTMVAARVHASPPTSTRSSAAQPLLTKALDAMPAFARVGPTLPPAAQAAVGKAAEHLMGAPPAGSPPDFDPGRADLAKARVLMASVGDAKRAIYAFPTLRGRVCSELTGFSAGCIDGFRARSPVGVTIGDPAADEPGIVWGLAPDSVVGVDVVVDGTPQRALLSNNAYFYQGSASATHFESLIVKLADGSTRNVALTYARQPSLN